MAAENVLEKTNRINRLFDFYQQLLTEKQQMFLKLYFHDNYSLGEIAEEFSISRQAVYEHIKRAEHMLDEYELKLKLLSKHEQRHHYLQQMKELLEGNNDSVNNMQIQDILDQLQAID